MDHHQLTKDILSHLGFPDTEIVVDTTDAAVAITITLPEDQSGILIGYHGEKIDALQLILNLMANPTTADFVPVQVDINNYRGRRKIALEELADKAKAKAIESGREILLPPLPPHERRLVHLHLQNDPDVSTYSEGEGRARRIVVRPAAAPTTSPPDSEQ